MRGPNRGAKPRDALSFQGEKGANSTSVDIRSLTRRALMRGALGAAGGFALSPGLSGASVYAAEASLDPPAQRPRACIYIFLSGGLAQQDSFDPKPDAPDTIRGEFKPIDTVTPGIRICEHLPLLAQRSNLWSLCRSLTHTTNDHSLGHAIMLTGRTEQAAGFDPNRPRPTDWPSIAAVAGALTRPRGNLPPSVVLPERLIHYSGRVIPGQFAGLMGSRRDPWFVDASPFHSTSYGAFPQYQFDHQERGEADKRIFQAPNLNLPDGLVERQFANRLEMLASIEDERRRLDPYAGKEDFDRFRAGAISLLADPKTRWAFDVTRADDAIQERYGKNSFGWSLLMARRLIEAGVNFVQVNLGNNESWDTHGEAFPHLKDKLLPPTDRALSALLDDLQETGMLENTLLVMAGEFGRTPKVTHLPQYYKLPGRDHWGAIQTLWLAGGGLQGGRVIGASDKIGGYPANLPQRPENMAATIYRALGVPATAAWLDELDRPHHIYYGDPIPGLS